MAPSSHHAHCASQKNFSSSYDLMVLMLLPSGSPGPFRAGKERGDGSSSAGISSQFRRFCLCSRLSSLLSCRILRIHLRQSISSTHGPPTKLGLLNFRAGHVKHAFSLQDRAWHGKAKTDVVLLQLMTCDDTNAPTGVSPIHVCNILYVRERAHVVFVWSSC